MPSTAPHYSTISNPPTTHFSGYDVLGRVGEKQSPTHAGTRTVTMSYAGLKVSYADQAGSATHHYVHDYDGLGKGRGYLVRVDQQEANGAWLTATYRYNAGGDLIRATDPEGNAIKATYDGFGDKLTLNDPDKGNWSYAYDDFGEQIARTNAEGDTINTTYDKLGRKTSE